MRVRLLEEPRPRRGGGAGRSARLRRSWTTASTATSEEQKAKQARKHQTQIHVKEIKLRPKIGIHDYETKKGHVVRFLNQRAKVKVTIMFRGRETTHPERGRDLLLRLAEDVKEIGQIESPAPSRRSQHGHGAGPTKNAGVKPDAKEKTSSGAKKRFKVTGTGKLMRRPR